MPDRAVKGNMALGRIGLVIFFVFVAVVVAPEVVNYQGQHAYGGCEPSPRIHHAVAASVCVDAAISSSTDLFIA